MPRGPTQKDKESSTQKHKCRHTRCTGRAVDGLIIEFSTIRHRNRHEKSVKHACEKDSCTLCSKSDVLFQELSCANCTYKTRRKDTFKLHLLACRGPVYGSYPPNNAAEEPVETEKKDKSEHRHSSFEQLLDEARRSNASTTEINARRELEKTREEEEYNVGKTFAATDEQFSLTRLLLLQYYLSCDINKSPKQ